MKAEQLFRSYHLAGFFVVVWLCLTCAINAQEPQPGGTPTVVHNEDGGTTTTEPVDFGKSQPDTPFKGKGEKLTTRDRDGNVTKVEWVKKGVVRRAVFIENGSETTTVTAYDYQSDGKTPVSKSEHSFGNNDGKLRSHEKKTYTGGGQVKGGTRYRFENGEWVSEHWDPETETWGGPARVALSWRI